MTLDQARKIMDARFSDTPPAYGDWVVAGQVIADHYARHPEKLRPVYTTDARTGPMLDLPGRTLDQPRYTGPEKSREWLAEQGRGVRLDESWATIQGSNTPSPGEEVGGDWVQDLPDGNYFIATNPRTQKAALFRYKLPRQDPGLVGRSNGGTVRTMDYYRGVARQMGTLRETTGTVLKGINRRNREAWSQK